MSYIDARIALINELTNFPGLTETEVGLVNFAGKNAERVQQSMTLEQEIDAAFTFDELGFRLDRIKRRIRGENVTVFNPRRMQLRGPRMAKVRLAG